MVHDNRGIALAIEPLAALIGSDSEVRGIRVGLIEEKISLYADDALLYLAHASTSLHKAISILNRFGEFSGIHINWDKSVLFPLYPRSTAPDTQTQLQWVESMKYLGITVTGDIADYVKLNLQPLMAQVSTKCAAWRALPLTPEGRVKWVVKENCIFPK